MDIQPWAINKGERENKDAERKRDAEFKFIYKRNGGGEQMRKGGKAKHGPRRMEKSIE